MNVHKYVYIFVVKCMLFCYNLFIYIYKILRGMYKMEKINVLINEARLEKRIEEIAKEIENDYKKEEEIIFLGILKGSVPFMWELSKKMKRSVQFEFIEVSSYKGTESTGEIVMHKDIKESIEGKNVIIVEDIIDTGRTLTYLKEHLLKKNPKSLKIATLLSKPSRRIQELHVDYVGFTIEDKFVVGFGLDYDQELRNLPYIGYIGD